MDYQGFSLHPVYLLNLFIKVSITNAKYATPQDCNLQVSPNDCFLSEKN